MVVPRAAATAFLRAVDTAVPIVADTGVPIVADTVVLRTATGQRDTFLHRPTVTSTERPRSLS